MPAEKVPFSHVGTWPIAEYLLLVKEFEDKRRKCFLRLFLSLYQPQESAALRVGPRARVFASLLTELHDLLGGFRHLTVRFHQERP